MGDFAIILSSKLDSEGYSILGIYIQGNRAKHLLSLASVMMIIFATFQSFLLIAFLLLFPTAFTYFNENNIYMSYFYARELMPMGFKAIAIFFVLYLLVTLAISLTFAAYGIKARQTTSKSKSLSIMGIIYLLIFLISFFFSSNVILLFPILAGVIYFIAGMLANKPAKFRSKHLQQIELRNIYENETNLYDPGIRRQ